MHAMLSLFDVLYNYCFLCLICHVHVDPTRICALALIKDTVATSMRQVMERLSEFWLK